MDGNIEKIFNALKFFFKIYLSLNNVEYATNIGGGKESLLLNTVKRNAAKKCLLTPQYLTVYGSCTYSYLLTICNAYLLIKALLN